MQRGCCPPLITVGELHVQAVAAEEGPPAQWGLQAARVGDGFTDEHQALQGGLQVGASCWGRLCRGLVNPHVSRAVQHLVGVSGGKVGKHVGLGLPWVWKVGLWGPHRELRRRNPRPSSRPGPAHLPGGRLEVEGAPAAGEGALHT